MKPYAVSLSQAGLGWAAFAGALGAMMGPAGAQDAPSPLAAGLLDAPEPPAPAVRRYETPDGGVRFVMDRRGPVALVQFEGEEEVHVLRPHPSAGGGEAFMTDTGDVLVRVTAFGGVVVFRDLARLGAPAAMIGSAEPLAAAPPARADVLAQLRRLERETAQRLGRPIAIDAPQARGEEGALVAEAATRAARGLAAAPHNDVTRVVIEFGPAPRAVRGPDGALRVTVTPRSGFAGRPSSELVRRVAAEERR